MNHKSLRILDALDPLITWLNSLSNELDTIKFFDDDDEISSILGIKSNNFNINDLEASESHDVDIEELKQEFNKAIKNSSDENDPENKLFAEFKDSNDGKNSEPIQLNHEEFLEMLGYTPEQIEKDKNAVRLENYGLTLNNLDEVRVANELIMSLFEHLINEFGCMVSHKVSNETRKSQVMDLEHMALGGKVFLEITESGVKSTRYFDEEE